MSAGIRAASQGKRFGYAIKRHPWLVLLAFYLVVAVLSVLLREADVQPELRRLLLALLHLVLIVSYLTWLVRLKTRDSNDYPSESEELPRLARWESVVCFMTSLLVPALAHKLSEDDLRGLIFFWAVVGAASLGPLLQLAW